MMNVLRVVLLVLVLAIPLAACRGGDDADSTEVIGSGSAPTSSTSVTTPTLGNPTPTLTESGTATATPEQNSSPESGEFTDDEAALIDLLLSAGDLDGSWTQLRVEAPELSESPGICDALRFPRAAERIAEVEVEYQSSDGASFVLQDITQFPEAIAVEAMQHIRQTTTCTEWTDETGTVFKISPAEDPQLGDESHAVHVAFQVADAGTLEGDFIFVRIDGYVTIVTTLVLADHDPALSIDVAQLATQKIDALIGTGSNTTDEESTLMEGLLTLDDLSESWDQLAPSHRSEPESWTGLCNAKLFPATEDAIARVAVEFYEGFESDSATLMQLLISYPTRQIEAAFEYERDAASCREFSSGDTDVTLRPADGFPSLGDDSFAIKFAFDSNERDVEGYWIVIRVANTLSTLIYTDPAGDSDTEIRNIANDAASRMESIVR